MFMVKYFLYFWSEKFNRINLECSSLQNRYSRMVNTIVNIGVHHNNRWFHFSWSMICVVVFINYFIQFLNIFIFQNCDHILVDLGLQGSDRSLRNNRFFFAMFCIHFNSIAMQSWLHWSIVKLMNLFDLQLEPFKKFWNALMIAISFPLSTE